MLNVITWWHEGPDDSDESKDDDDDICSQPALKPGAASCRAFLVRWTFSSKTKKCEKITYGGCKGTENLFDTEYACNAKCNRKGKFFLNLFLIDYLILLKINSWAKI